MYPYRGIINLNMKNEDFREIILAENTFIWNGVAGSGSKGHTGRKGKRGGSVTRGQGSGVSSDATSEWKNKISELLSVWNAWDSKKHPRDHLGRFTFVVHASELTSDVIIDRTILSSQTTSKLCKQLDEAAAKSPATEKQYKAEKKAVMDYQDAGYLFINNALRSGDMLVPAEHPLVKALDESCRFSSDKPIKVYRGEDSKNDYWKGVQVGDSMPKGLRYSFISTSVDKVVADRFATKRRTLDNGTDYETTIEFIIPPNQRFGIPNVHNTVGNVSSESEILLPFNTKGVVKEIKETKSEYGDKNLVQRTVKIEITGE